VEGLSRLNKQLREAVRAFPADRLDEPLVPEAVHGYTQFIGVTQHNLYHTGPDISAEASAHHGLITAAASGRTA